MRSCPACIFSRWLVHRPRPAKSVFFEGLRFRREAARWSLDQKMEWILQRLRFSVRRAYRETIYYRELFDRIGFDPLADFSFEDFSRLPALGREDVHRAGQQLVSGSIPADRLRRDATGGRAERRPRSGWVPKSEGGARAPESVYATARDALGTRIGYFWGHHLDPVATDSLRDRLLIASSPTPRLSTAFDSRRKCLNVTTGNSSDGGQPASSLTPAPSAIWPSICWSAGIGQTIQRVVW